MKNREVFQRDPVVTKLVNDGVAAVTEAVTEQEIETLRYELEHFVCAGQYADGLIRILESYIGPINATTQPAAWISGFYGSGKSHLLKMFRHLWVNTPFADGATARDLARLPQEVQDLLRELDTLGKRYGGLHAAAGTLPSGSGESARLTVLSIIMRSRGLPESLPQAQFCLWLQRNGMYEKIRTAVEAAGRDFRAELRDLYVSPLLAQAITVVPADFIFDQLQPDLLRTGVLLREIDETIRNLDDGTPDGKLAKRLCGLIFLIRKLPREPMVDLGIRATGEMFADLLVNDLSKEGTQLRKEIPSLLQKLVVKGKLIKLTEAISERWYSL